MRERAEGRDKEGGGEGRDGIVGMSSSTSVASLSSASFFCGIFIIIRFLAITSCTEDIAEIWHDFLAHF